MPFRKSTPEDVRWTYRLLLAREPEEHDILEKLDQNVFTDDLVKFVLSSAEYQSRTKSYSAREAAAAASEGVVLATRHEKVLPALDSLIHFDDIPAEDEIGFVEALYLRILGRPSDAGGLESHVALMQSNTLSRLELIETFMASDEFVSRGKRVTLGRIG